MSASRATLARIDAALTPAPARRPRRPPRRVHSNASPRRSGQRLPSTITCAGGTAQREQRAPHGEHRRLQDVERVDLRGVRPAEAPGEARGADRRREHFTPRGRQHFRVREAAIGRADRGSPPPRPPGRRADRGPPRRRPPSAPAPRQSKSACRGSAPAHADARRARQQLEDRVGGSRAGIATQLPVNLREGRRQLARSGRSSCASTAGPSTSARTSSWKNSGTSRRAGKQVRLREVLGLDEPRAAAAASPSAAPPGRRRPSAACTSVASSVAVPDATSTASLAAMHSCARPSTTCTAHARRELRERSARTSARAAAFAIGATNRIPGRCAASHAMVAANGGASRADLAQAAARQHRHHRSPTAWIAERSPRGGRIAGQRNAVGERMADELRAHVVRAVEVRSRTAAGTAPGRRIARSCAPDPAARPTPAG